MATTIVYRPIQEKDVDQVKEMLHTSFFNPKDGDPISQVLKYEAPRETRCYVDGIMPAVLADGVSVVAIDSASGEVVGFRLSHHITRDCTKELVVSKTDPDTRKMWITMDILKQARSGVDIFEKYNVDSYVMFLALSVKSSHRGLGIAKRLVEKCIELVVSKGIRVIIVEATSSFSKRIFDKLGFETLAELRYHDYFVDGERFCSDGGIAGHEGCALCAKYL